MAKSKEDSQYMLLSGENFVQREPTAPLAREEDSDSSQKSPVKKLGFIKKKFFKSKPKNSDDEATISSVYDHQSKKNETDSSSESANASAKTEQKGVINRKKKRSMSFYDNKFRQQFKHPGFAKIRSTSEKPKKNKKTSVHGNTEQGEDNSSSAQQDPKAVVGFIEEKERILEQFDPLWVGNVKKENKSGNHKNRPMKPINNEKILSKNLPVMKIPELKVATMEAIQENDFPLDEEIEVMSHAKNPQGFARASVSYEGLEGVFVTPVIKDYSASINEGICPIASIRNADNSNLNDVSVQSYAGALPVSVQPRKNPWKVWPGLFEEASGSTKDALPDEQNDDPKKTSGDWLEEPNPIDDLNRLLFESNEEEQKRNNMIADFFAEEARVLNEQDISNYTTNIEISKIEIYEEDVKKYHQSLKYHRGPIDHDIMFTTVETALNFIEKLTKEREQKKKVSFLPELLEKCLKSKAKREKEKEEEERKKREKEEKKSKGPLKPKMWLVFNRLSKEKVIICTPGEFYDSD